MVKLSDIFNIMEEIAPMSLAESWDNIGLQIGNPEEELQGVMLALDASIEAVEDAANSGFNLLLTHHPLFFSPLSSININSPSGKLIEASIKKSVSIFSSHTNLDSVSGGVSDMLADLLELGNREPIEPANASGEGLGRMGTLSKALSIEEIVTILKKKLSAKNVGVIGDTNMRVNKVALCGGSGGSLIGAASRLGADLFISGDIKYHQAREAEELALPVIDVGHFSSEKIAIDGLKNILKAKLKKRGIKVPLKIFEKEKEPFIIL